MSDFPEEFELPRSEAKDQGDTKSGVAHTMATFAEHANTPLQPEFLQREVKVTAKATESTLRIGTGLEGWEERLESLIDRMFADRFITDTNRFKWAGKKQFIKHLSEFFTQTLSQVREEAKAEEHSKVRAFLQKLAWDSTDIASAIDWIEKTPLRLDAQGNLISTLTPKQPDK